MRYCFNIRLSVTVVPPWCSWTYPPKLQISLNDRLSSLYWLGRGVSSKQQNSNWGRAHLLTHSIVGISWTYGCTFHITNLFIMVFVTLCIAGKQHPTKQLLEGGVCFGKCMTHYCGEITLAGDIASVQVRSRKRWAFHLACLLVFSPSWTPVYRMVSSVFRVVLPSINLI